MNFTNEQKHAIDMLRTSCEHVVMQLDSMEDNLYNTSKEFHEKWISEALYSQYAALFYLWIQTGISLPNSIDDDTLVIKLQQFAENSKHFKDEADV